MNLAWISTILASFHSFISLLRDANYISDYCYADEKKKIKIGGWIKKETRNKFKKRVAFAKILSF